MEITVLGPLTVNGAGILGRRDRVALAVLVSRLGRPVAPDTLEDAIWGDDPPASAAKNVQGCMVRLRRLLGGESIATTALGYSLTAAPDEIDAWRFDRLVARARELLSLSGPDRASYQLDQALALWRGEPFVDLEGWPPAGPVVRRFVELRQEAEELNAEAGLAAGRMGEVLATCQRLVGEAPLREQRWALLARAQYQAGHQGEALRTIHQLKGVLARQLGIDLSPDLVALEQAVLQQDPSLAVPESAGQPMKACPWPGLQAYDVDEADWFFGREREVADCLSLLRIRSFLALAGPSGTGKSSLLRAGLGAALRERGHRLLVTTPGTRAMDSLSPLGGAARDTVLLIDQAEEVFTLCPDETQQREYLDAVVAEAEHRTVLISIRADRLSEVTGHVPFSRLVERGLYLVGGLDNDALRVTIEKPARQAGLLVEPGLVDLLVTELNRDPGALPLLSHALQETWRRREGRTLTVAGYRESGGINGAVAQTAERLYGDLDPGDRDDLRELMLRLVMPDQEGVPVPAKVPRRLLSTSPERAQLVERLVGARLVTSGDEVVTMSHEALARAWPRLRSWLDDDLDGQRIRHHLAATADGWNALGRPDTEFYRGVRLSRALAWREQRRPTLTAVEGDFLEASRQAEERAERSLAEQARRQGELIRRLRSVLTGALVLLVLALAAGGLAAVQSDRAQDSAAAARRAADLAREAALSADARRVGARAQLADDISLSLLLAIAGVRLDDAPETRANLLSAMSERPQLVRSAPAATGFLNIMAASPDGRWIASSDKLARMHLYDTSTNEVVRSYDARHRIGGVSGGGAASQSGFIVGAFSPDGTLLAVTLPPNGPFPAGIAVRLLDPDTMQPTVARLSNPFGAERITAGDLQFSADGRYLATSVVTPERTLGVVWDISSPAKPAQLVPIEEGDWNVALSPDGQTLYTSSPLTAYDVAEGTQTWRRSKVSSRNALDINPAGTLLALESSGNQRVALLVDAATGRTMATLRGHEGAISGLRFSPDGSLLGTASPGGEIIVWDIATGARLDWWATFERSWTVGFSPDGGLVHTGGDDAMLRTWDRSTEQTYLRRTGQVTDSVDFLHPDVSPDGARVAYRWADSQGRGWVRFVDTATGEATPAARLAMYEDTVPLGTWHPEGELYVGHGCDLPACSRNGTLTVLDATTGELVKQRRVFKTDIDSLAYVDGNQSLLAGDRDRTTQLFDAETLLPKGGPFDVPSDCCTTPIDDGSTALVYQLSTDGTSYHWRVIDVHTGVSESAGGDVDLSAYASVASPDGSTVAVAGDTGEIVTIDISTGDEHRRSPGSGAPVYWLDYSDDGKLLVSGAANGGVSLWDAATLDLLGTVSPPHRGKPVPAGAQFIGDSHDVAIASHDGRVYRWETDLERAIDFACQMAGRNLTEQEWAEVLPDQPYREVCPRM